MTTWGIPKRSRYLTDLSLHAGKKNRKKTKGKLDGTISYLPLQAKTPTIHQYSYGYQAKQAYF